MYFKEQKNQRLFFLFILKSNVKLSNKNTLDNTIDENINGAPKMQNNLSFVQYYSSKSIKERIAALASSLQLKVTKANPFPLLYTSVTLPKEEKAP